MKPDVALRVDPRSERDVETEETVGFVGEKRRVQRSTLSRVESEVVGVSLGHLATAERRGLRQVERADGLADWDVAGVGRMTLLRRRQSDRGETLGRRPGRPAGLGSAHRTQTARRVTQLESETSFVGGRRGHHEITLVGRAQELALQAAGREPLLAEGLGHGPAHVGEHGDARNQAAFETVLRRHLVVVDLVVRVGGVVERHHLVAERLACLTGPAERPLEGGSVVARSHGFRPGPR